MWFDKFFIDELTLNQKTIKAPPYLIFYNGSAFILSEKGRGIRNSVPSLLPTFHLNYIIHGHSASGESSQVPFMRSVLSPVLLPERPGEHMRGSLLPPRGRAWEWKSLPFCFHERRQRNTELTDPSLWKSLPSFPHFLSPFSFFHFLLFLRGHINIFHNCKFTTLSSEQFFLSNFPVI